MRLIALSLLTLTLNACLRGVDPIDPVDSGPAATDTGRPPAADAGSQPSADAGSPPGADGGAVVVEDGGPAPVDDAGQPIGRDAGAPVGDAGLPAGVCGTRGGIADCGAGAYCNFPIAHHCGRTDRGGQCAYRPEVCPDLYAPVCGCDGQTYSNECDAAGAGVSIEHRGSCEAGCGIGEGRTCGEGQFCLARGPSCGETRPEGGTCETLTRGCPAVMAPVCGCDDQTYNNLCLLVNAQVQLKSEGACANLPPPPPPPPGDGACGPPRTPYMCAASHFCDRPVGQCPVHDESVGGTCQPRPQACTRIYAPVCGCDGHTHGNECEAKAAGTSVRSQGPCP